MILPNLLPNVAQPYLGSPNGLPNAAQPYLFNPNGLPNVAERHLCNRNGLPNVAQPYLCNPNGLPTVAEPYLCSPNGLPTVAEPYLCSPNKLPTVAEPYLCSPNGLPSSGESLFLFWGKSLSLPGKFLILPIPGKVSSFRGTSLPAGENHLSGRLVGPGGEQCTWEVSEKLENMIWPSFWRLFRAPARGRGRRCVV